MRRRSSFQPYCAYDAMGYIRVLRIAAEQQGDIVQFLMWTSTKDYIWAEGLGVGQIKEYGEPQPARYVKAQADPIKEAAQFKRLALERGATPEAIRLLGLLAPVSKQEEITMAEKLKAKGAAKASGKAATKGDAEALKEAAATAPVAKGKGKAAAATDAPKKKGNPEALEKARAARAGDQEAERKKKLTLVQKDNPKREGTRAFDIYAKYKTCKTVGAFLDAGGTMADIRYDSQKGFITVG